MGILKKTYTPRRYPRLEFMGIYGNPKENLHSKALPPIRKSEKKPTIQRGLLLLVGWLVGCRQHTQRPPAGAMMRCNIEHLKSNHLMFGNFKEAATKWSTIAQKAGNFQGVSLLCDGRRQEVRFGVLTLSVQPGSFAGLRTATLVRIRI